MEEIKICSKCGTEFTGNFCPRCRNAMLSTCPRCKAHLEGNERFCPACGKLLKAKSITSGIKARIKMIFKKIREGFNLKVGIITAVCVVLVVSLSVGLAICIPKAQNPFKEEKLNALALGMTKEEVKAVFKHTDDIKNIDTDIWQIFDEEADKLIKKIYKTAREEDTNFNTAAQQEKELLQKLKDLEHQYVYIRFVNNEAVEIIYDTAHKHSQFSSSSSSQLDEAKFMSAREKTVTGYTLSRDELVSGSALDTAKIGCKVTFSDGSIYHGYVKGYIENNKIRPEKVTYETPWFKQEITLNVVEKLSTSCPGHALDSDCQCVICLNVIHTQGSYCVCTRCNTEMHKYGADLTCTRCDHVNIEKVKEGMGEKQYYKINDRIYFGYYPQSQVIDDEILNALGDFDVSTWTSYEYMVGCETKDYMYYKDVEYNNEKYRGVYFTSYRPSFTGDTYDENHDALGAGTSSQDEHGYKVGNVYWFRYEPIKWRILSQSAEGKALILCDMLLDAQCYYPTAYLTERTEGGNTIYENNYEYSFIRSWLNNEFYNTAFTELEKSLIEITEVVNDVYSTGDATNEYACNNTFDKIFLPSCRELREVAYGFQDTHLQDSAREKQPTEYALSQGAYERTRVNGNGVWWLRSPHNSEGYYAHYIIDTGDIDCSYKVWNTLFGVAPMLTMNLAD